MINTERIQSQVDTDRLQQATVAIIGVGGSMTLLEALTRCGVGHFKLFDFDTVSESNVARQGHDRVGVLKVDAAASRIRAINPDVNVLGLPTDVTCLSSHDADVLFDDVDLMIFAVDRFAANAWGNSLALRLQKSAMWLGAYQAAGAGELVFWQPGIDACYRCLMEHRYAAQQEARAEGNPLDPNSDGTLFQDLMILDGIASHYAVGLLTQGADNYFGRLIAELGDRNFLQVQLRHDWRLRGGEPVRQALGVATENDAFFCWDDCHPPGWGNYLALSRLASSSAGIGSFRSRTANR